MLKIVATAGVASVGLALTIIGCTDSGSATPSPSPPEEPASPVSTPFQSRAVLLLPTSAPTPTATATAAPMIDGEYDVEIVKVLDGDTVEVEIERVEIAGLRSQTIRIEGVDTPETRTSNPFEKDCGNWSKERVVEFTSDEGQYMLITEFDDGAFGRILGDIRSPDGAMLSEFLLDEGLAVRYEGGTRDFEDHRENCDRLVNAGHIEGPEETPTATATENPRATPVTADEPSATPTSAQDPTPTATAVPVDPAETFETCEEAAAAGLERVKGDEGTGRGFPIEIVTGERDGDGDGYVCEESGPSDKEPTAVVTKVPTDTATPEPVPTATAASHPPDQIYENCKAAEDAGLERKTGKKGDGRGFPAELVPSARDGDGDGVVCEK